MRNPYLLGAVEALARSAPVYALIAVAACVGGKLTPAAESTILTVELAACESLSAEFMPAASVACAGSEAVLKSALDRVTAASALATVGASAAPKRKVTRVVAGKPVVCGYVPATIAPAVQAQLDATSDAGAEGGAL